MGHIAESQYSVIGIVTAQSRRRPADRYVDFRDVQFLEKNRDGNSPLHRCVSIQKRCEQKSTSKVSKETSQYQNVNSANIDDGFKELFAAFRNTAKIYQRNWHAITFLQKIQRKSHTIRIRFCFTFFTQLSWQKFYSWAELKKNNKKTVSKMDNL